MYAKLLSVHRTMAFDLFTSNSTNVRHFITKTNRSLCFVTIGIISLMKQDHACANYAGSSYIAEIHVKYKTKNKNEIIDTAGIQLTLFNVRS